MTKILGRLHSAGRLLWTPSRNVSNFVKRMKLLDSLKDNDTECSNYLRSGKFLYFHQNRPLIRRNLNFPASIAWVTYEATHHAYSKMKTPLMIEDKSVLLNVGEDGNAQFAFQLGPIEDDKIPYIEEMFGGTFEDLRAILLTVPNGDLNLISKASALLYWHRKFLFCPSCGSKNLRNSAGSHRICSSCKTIHYPRLSPVGIVLVVDEDKCLLVRQSRHPPGMYSAIAGFAEAGESLEETIHREVAEEVGLEVENIVYLKSQYWPFPASSLMVGCLATVKSNQKLLIDTRELEDAKWFTANTVLEAAEKVKKNPAIIFSNTANSLLIPPPGPVAHSLITTWLQRIV